MNGISRRRFAQLLGVGAAAAAVVKPRLSFSAESPAPKPASGVVRLSANENPYGPSPRALDAMRADFGGSCRYPDEANDLRGQAPLRQSIGVAQNKRNKPMQSRIGQRS